MHCELRCAVANIAARCLRAFLFGSRAEPRIPRLRLFGYSAWICLATLAYGQSVMPVPGAINFPDQIEGTISPKQTITVTNSGTAPVRISSVSISPAEFVLTSGGTVTLPPGSQAHYSLDFAPDSAQAFTGNLTLNVENHDPLVISLRGTGTATLAITPPLKNFGRITVGQSTKGTIFKVTNVGTRTVPISSATVSSSEFQLISHPPTGLSPGSSIEYRIVFAPDTSGSFNGTFAVWLDNDTVPAVAQLVGTGVASTAAVTVSPSSLFFPNVPRGTQSGVQTVTIRNTGEGPVTVADVYVTPPFLLSGFTAPLELQTGQSVQMGVSLFGTAAGIYTGTVNMTYDQVSSTGLSLKGSVALSNALSGTTLPNLPRATQSFPYLAMLRAAGGIPPYTWRLTDSSSLPLGLKLSSTGTIKGTLDVSVPAKTYKFAVHVTDSSTPAGTATEGLFLVVQPPTGANCNDISFNVPGTATPLVALTDLGTGTYLGVEGGLYPKGSNARPAEQEAAGLGLASSIQPLDANGNPNSHGKYALLSLGESDTAQEYAQFMQMANADPSKNGALVLVNGAMAGGDAKVWADPNNSYWTNLFNNILPQAGVTADQVVAVWVQAINTEAVGTYPKDMVQTHGDLVAIAQNLHNFFPNLQLAYYSGRVYGGYSNDISTVDPEPYAYDSNLAARGAIEDQLNGKPGLNWNPANGPVMAPWLSWGPYYWSNGMRGRSDGLVWTCQDLRNDGVHPSDPIGREKVASQLLNFFENDSTTAPWFLVH
jgi:hypothetical protein